MHSDNRLRRELSAVERDVIASAPLLLRFMDGYIDPKEIPSDDDIAFARSLGVEHLPAPRRYPPVAHWGVEVGAGWLPIVAKAVLEIEAVLRELLESGLALDDLPAVLQIKEKFGELRFYLFSSGPGLAPRISALCDGAAELASHACQRCGAPGRLRLEPFRSVLCDAHAASRGQDRALRE
jgi:hypothetical protein